MQTHAREILQNQLPLGMSIGQPSCKCLTVYCQPSGNFVWECPRVLAGLGQISPGVETNLFKYTKLFSGTVWYLECFNLPLHTFASRISVNWTKRPLEVPELQMSIKQPGHDFLEANRSIYFDLFYPSILFSRRLCIMRKFPVLPAVVNVDKVSQLAVYSM